jgi:hypothetical protein
LPILWYVRSKVHELHKALRYAVGYTRDHLAAIADSAQGAIRPTLTIGYVLPTQAVID